MKVIHQYDRDKDIWCLLNKGKSSNNSQSPTKVYEQLVLEYGDKPTHDETSAFIDKYATSNGINFEEYVNAYRKDWKSIADEYNRRAENVFGVSLPNDVRAYLTINSRCPYSIRDSAFFTLFHPRQAKRRPCMSFGTSILGMVWAKTKRKS